LGALFLTDFHRTNRGLSVNRESTQMLINGDRYHRALHPILAVTFCVICMPEAFCGLEMCAKRFCYVCEFCERWNSPASLKNVLFLTEEHRWTEHTKFHRDIKSTDNTERYSQH